MSGFAHDVWAAWQAGRAGRPAVVAAPAAAPLVALAAAMPEPALLPPRQWLYGTRYVHRFVSVLVAPGGVGKSALALGQAVAVASGRGFLGERVHHAAPAWVLNLEDPAEETERRLAALMCLHAIPRAALEGRLFLHSGRSRRVVMAELDESAGVRHPDRDAVTAAALAAGIGLIVVDPFVKSHRVDENSNGQIDAAATAWAEVAEATGAAVLLVHHVRKGAAAGADAEAARGAKALTDAARSAALLAPMTEAEAERLGVAQGERWRHVRLDDAKANLAPRQGAGSAETALWYRLQTVALGNATAAYPNGDQVAAIARWHPEPAAGAGARAARAETTRGADPARGAAGRPAWESPRQAAAARAATPVPAPSDAAPGMPMAGQGAPSRTRPADAGADVPGPRGGGAEHAAAGRDRGGPGPVAPDPGAPATSRPGAAEATSASPMPGARMPGAPTPNAPSSASPTSASPTSASPTSASPTSASPTSASPTSASPTSASPTSASPTSVAPTPNAPTSSSPTSAAPTSVAPTSAATMPASPMPGARMPGPRVRAGTEPDPALAATSREPGQRVAPAPGPPLLDERAAAEALARIAAGLGAGQPWNAVRGAMPRHGRDRWVGRVLVEACALTEDEAAAAIADWLRRGVLVRQPYHDPAQRKRRVGVRLGRPASTADPAA